MMPFITKEDFREAFKLTDVEAKDTLATFDIKHDSQLTKKMLAVMLQFLKKTKNIEDVDIDNLEYSTVKKEKEISLENIIQNRDTKKAKVKLSSQLNKSKIKPTKKLEDIPTIEVLDNKHNNIRNEDEINKSKCEEDIVISDKKIKLLKKKSTNKDIEITGIVGKQERVIDVESKKDKIKISKNSYMQSRYELYIEDCKKNDCEPVDISLYKDFGEYPINSDYIFNKILQNTTYISEDLRKINGKPKNASKIFNSGYKIYYAKRGESFDILCQLDITKPFNTNLSLVSKSKDNHGFDFYTKGEQFDVSLIERVVSNTGREWSKEEDDKILAFYTSDDYADANKKTKNKSITLKDLAKEFGVYPETVRSRAVQLGFINFKKPKDKNWSKDELNLLQSCIGKYNPKKISKIFKENGFTRGHVGIAIKIKRLGFSLKLDGSEEINLKMLSEAMGVDSHFFYDNNRLEKLKARKENNQMIFKREDIVNYLRNNPYDFAIGKVEPKWFIDILTQNYNTENSNI